MRPPDGEGEGLPDEEGLTDALGLAEAEGDRLAEAEIEEDGLLGDGEAEAEGDMDGLPEGETEVEGLREAEGLTDGLADCRVTPSSTRAWLQERVSRFLRMSRLEPNLNDPFTPRSSKSEIPARKFVIS
mgnify:CR=1 FL=1